jgi:hypothetical protein
VPPVHSSHSGLPGTSIAADCHHPGFSASRLVYHSQYNRKHTHHTRN